MDTGLHHGMACALSLGPTFDILRQRGIADLNILAEAFDSEPDSFSNTLSEFLHELGAPSRLKASRNMNWEERIMGTDMIDFQRNFNRELSNKEVKWIISSIQ